MKDLHDELGQMRLELDLTQRVYCSKEEEKQFKKMLKEKQLLPDDINFNENGHFRYIDTDLTKEELDNLFLYRQITYLRSIKNSMIFFVVLTLVSLTVSLLVAFR